MPLMFAVEAAHHSAKRQHDPTRDQVPDHGIRRHPVTGQDDHCSGNRQQSPKDLLSKADDHGFARFDRMGKLAKIATSVHPLVDDAERELQVLRDPLKSASQIRDGPLAGAHQRGRGAVGG